MNLASILVVAMLALGCGGVAMAQPPRPPQAKAANPFGAALAANARKDYATALKLLRPLVDKGDPQAQYVLGGMYETGKGVAENSREAVRLYGLSAARGNAQAQYALGLWYYYGWAGAQNYEEAARLWGLAAAQGDKYSQTFLGSMYEDGKGTAQDYVRAHMWYNVAAISGDGLAIYNRERVAAKMTPAQVERAQEMARKCQQSNFKQCD